MQQPWSVKRCVIFWMQRLGITRTAFSIRRGDLSRRRSVLIGRLKRVKVLLGW